MRGLLVGFVLAFLLIFQANGQQDPQYSQYMFNQMAVNPGYAGSHDAICATAVHREQWTGFQGNPSTSVFHVNGAINKINSGVGVTILSDKLGFDQNISFGLDYAYRFNVGPGKLGVGISGLYMNKALKAKWYIPNGAPENDPDIPGENESTGGFDMGFGLFYRAERVYLGLSTTHLLEPSLKYEKEANFKLKRHYYVSAGCLIPLQNPAWELSPTLWINSDGVSTQFTANINVMFNKKVWGGVGYRLNDAVIAMIGIDLFNGLKIGYSYDYTYTSIRQYSGGSHEVMLGYCFNLIKEKVSQKYKSVRFL